MRLRCQTLRPPPYARCPACPLLRALARRRAWTPHEGIYRDEEWYTSIISRELLTRPYVVQVTPTAETGKLDVISRIPDFDISPYEADWTGFKLMMEMYMATNTNTCVTSSPITSAYRSAVVMRRQLTAIPNAAPRAVILATEA